MYFQLYESFQDFPACPSEISCKYMTISVEHCWKDTDRRKRSIGRQTRYSVTVPTLNLTGSDRERTWGVRGKITVNNRLG
jgi:hypothetical protein